MTIGYIGLGKMGFGMSELLLEKGHQVVAYNRTPERTRALAAKGATAARSITELVDTMPAPRTVWLMVPHQVVDDVLAALMPLLVAGDVVIDGGNSPYNESVRRSTALAHKKIDFLDVGVSGGPAGARTGACMMVGGTKEIYDRYEHLFRDLCVTDGYGYMGKSGAGHFVKMVHNGIEYGMMQAIAEGFALMKKKDIDLDLEKIAHVYGHGSVITSSLIAWLEHAYKEQGQDLDAVSGEVSHSGEGLWTVEEAQRLGVPVDIIARSLAFREHSQGNPSYTGQVVSALRNQFGGHHVEKTKEQKDVV